MKTYFAGIWTYLRLDVDIFSIWAFLDRFHLIIPEIGILASGNQVSEFLLPSNHLYQACSGPGLREVPVDTFQLSGSRKICISFGNLEDENGKTES